MMNLKEFFTKHPKVAVAFSGGVDSAYLLYAAGQFAENARAYYAKSAFQPQFELDDAKRLAEQLSMPLEVIDIDVLADSDVVDNPPNRCYFCKRRIFSAIQKAARNDGFSVILDGTNASDDVSDRPGMAALKELSVLSPLRMCGLAKAEIRRLSKEAGLFTWDKPAYACLATRIPTGVRIEKRLLEMTENAENFLMLLGFKDLRVRTFNGCARIQIPAMQFEHLLECRERILKRLGQDYDGVLLDLEARDGQ